MDGKYSWPRKLRFFTNIAILYLLTIGFGWYILRPATALAHPTSAISRSSQKPYTPSTPKFSVISGLPVRIVIPSDGVDLPVDPGYYNATTNAWTLSGYRAQFAMISTVANNLSGDTFIYGHNNDYVFGALRHVTPAPGATALIYTDNGHIFAYSFVSSVSLGPDDTSVLSYQGPPMLTIQTCTGSVNEWRTMYKFSFSKVVQ